MDDRVLPRQISTGSGFTNTQKTNDSRVHCLRPILLFDLEASMHNKRLRQVAMSNAEYLHGIADE
eukprot:8671035-Ditylum_brightwellii.AAC.1